MSRGNVDDLSMANYTKLLTHWASLTAERDLNLMPGLIKLISENNSLLFTLAIKDSLKKNKDLTKNLDNFYNSEDSLLVQQRITALNFLSFDEKKRIIATLKTSSDFRLKVYLLPSTFIAETMSLKTLDATYKYALITFIVKIGSLFFNLIGSELTGDNLSTFTFQKENVDSAQYLHDIHKYLGIYLLSMLIIVDPNVKVIKESWGYTLNLTTIYTVYNSHIRHHLSLLKRFPINLLPPFKEPRDHELTNFIQQTGIYSHSPGRGLRITRLESSYFLLINLMQKCPHKINTNVLFALTPCLDKSLENVTPKEVWSLLWPTLQPRVIMKKKLYLNKQNRWKFTRFKTYSKTNFYYYQRDLPTLILTTATLYYKTGKSFFINYFSDPRGRIYSGNLLSAFQGDLSRALLSVGDYIYFYPATYLKNCFLYGRRFFPQTRNFSKAELYKYISENIHSLLRDDLKNNNWPKKKKESHQYLAWLLEIEYAFKFLRNKFVEGKLLGFYDMSSSGLQLLAFLTAADLNSCPDFKDNLYHMNFLITDSENDPLHDIYSDLIENFLLFYNNLEKHTPEMLLYLLLLKLAGGNFRRKVSKTFVMKLLYSATMYTSVKDNLKLFRSLSSLKTNTELIAKLEAFNSMDFKIMFITVRSFLSDFQMYLRTTNLKTIYLFIDSISVLWENLITHESSKNKFLHLRNDAYFTNYFDYRKLKKIRTQVTLKENLSSDAKRKKFALITYEVENTSPIREQKLKQAFLANLIHTIDSEILRAAVILSNFDQSENRRKIYDTLHDCVSGNIGSSETFNAYFLSAFKLFFLGQDSTCCQKDLLQYKLQEKILPIIDVQQLFKGTFGSYFSYLETNTLTLTASEKKDYEFLQFYFLGSYKKNIESVLHNLTGKAQIVI